MTDSANGDTAADFQLSDPDQFYARYLETCRRAGVESVSRERALGLVEEWNEVLSGCPEPTQH
jgi:hypothetical protein